MDHDRFNSNSSVAHPEESLVCQRPLQQTPLTAHTIITFSSLILWRNTNVWDDGLISFLRVDSQPGASGIRLKQISLFSQSYGRRGTSLSPVITVTWFMLRFEPLVKALLGLSPLRENVQPQFHERSQQHGPQWYAHEWQLHICQFLQLGAESQAEAQLEQHGR